ncbi:hypothetical protein H0H93_008191, partial [Arthromyces matolae]
MSKIRLSKKRLSKDRPPTPSYTPHRGPRAHQVGTRKGRIPSLIFIPHGETLAQRSYLPDRPHSALPQPVDDDNPLLDDDNPLVDHGHVDHNVENVVSSRHRRKRERQWANWHARIPTLILPYLDLLHKSNSLRDLPCVVDDDCLCDEPKRPLKVIIVRFESPQEPTLAVDFRVLDFVSTLFLHVAPNNTAWCETIETFLSKQGYKLPSEGSMRKRFGNALTWYNALLDEAAYFVDK